MHASPGLAALPSRTSVVRDAMHTVALARMISAVILCWVGLLAACRDTMAARPHCGQYPLPWQPTDEAQAAAQAELAVLSPGANMTWNAATGTLMSISRLAIPLPGCVDGQDVTAQVFRVFEAHPAVFQLDLTEWQIPEPFDCKYMTGDTTLNMGRRYLAGRPVAKDVFAYSLTRISGTAYLTAVTGTYLPVIDAAMGDTMASCNRLTEHLARATARHTPLAATVLSQCRNTGTVTYVPKANDVFSLSPTEAWTWQEDTGQVLLTGQRTLRVTVNPANYTPELMSSDARCPVLVGNGDRFTIGFDIFFDVHTIAIIGVKPGLDCIVC
jgi:hypothetical protein